MFSCVFNILQSVHFSWLSVWSKSCQYWKEIVSLLAFCIHASAILHVIFHLVVCWFENDVSIGRKWCGVFNGSTDMGWGAGCWRVHILMSRVFLDAQALGDLALMTSIIRPRFLTWLAWLKKNAYSNILHESFFFYVLSMTHKRKWSGFLLFTVTHLPPWSHPQSPKPQQSSPITQHPPPGLCPLALKWCRPPHWMCDLQNFDVPFVLNSCRSNFDWRS